MSSGILGLCSFFIGFLPWALPANELPRYFVVGRQPWRVSADSTITRYELEPQPQIEAICGTTVFSASSDMRRAVVGRRHELFLIDLQTGTEAQISHHGREWDAHFAAVEVLFTSWGAHSNSILFCVMPGDTFQEDHPDLRVRRASYGFYEYDVRTKSVRKVAKPFEFQVRLSDGRMIGVDGRTPPIVQELRWVRAGKLGPVVTPGLAGSFQVAASGDAKRLLVSVNNPPTSQIYIVDLNSGKAEAISPKGRYAEYQRPSFSPSSEHRAYLQGGPVHSGLVATNLIVDGNQKFGCSTFLDYAWIDEQRIGLLCDSTVYVLDAASGAILGQHAFD